ncbi:MAG TPA: MBL fold metallo-hydrolase [Vicinamibacterales bacterium]|nr:MBL fold metallo-hydrolase [Vicinamibacterales bacterium]
MRSALMAAVVLSAASVAAQQEDFSKVEIKPTKLADGLYMLTGAGGNIGLSVGDDAVFLVDDQYAPLTERIKAAIAAITDKPVRFVLNTHWHFDHTGGNENLGQAGALIVAHDNVRKRMSVEQFIKDFNMKIPASPKAALPIITFSETTTFHLNGEEIQAVHVPPAHTDGDSLVHYRKANVLHMGDTFFNGAYPFFDMSSGGSIEGMIGAAEKALSLANASTKIIPGHGPLADRKALEVYLTVLKTSRDRIGTLVSAGKSADEVIAARPLAEYDATWGKGFIQSDQFVRLVHASLSGQR